MTKREMIGRVKGAAAATAEWIAEKRIGRDVLVLVGALLIARGFAQLLPGSGTIVLGLVCLYVALWHGPLTAYLLRPRGEKE